MHFPPSQELSYSRCHALLGSRTGGTSMAVIVRDECSSCGNRHMLCLPTKTRSTATARTNTTPINKADGSTAERRSAKWLHLSPGALILQSNHMSLEREHPRACGVYWASVARQGFPKLGRAFSPTKFVTSSQLAASGSAANLTNQATQPVRGRCFSISSISWCRKCSLPGVHLLYSHRVRLRARSRSLISCRRASGTEGALT